MADTAGPSTTVYEVPSDDNEEIIVYNPDQENPPLHTHECNNSICMARSRWTGPPNGISKVCAPMTPYVYQTVLDKIKSQLGYPPNRRLTDIPEYRIDDIGVAVKMEYAEKVRDMLQRQRNSVHLSAAQDMFLTQHIGWQEIECHREVLKEDRTLYTMTNNPPRFFFPQREPPNCIECSSTHNVNAVRRSCFPLDQHGPQVPKDVTYGHKRLEQIQAIYVGTENMYLHPTLFHRVLNLSIIKRGMGYKVGFQAPYEPRSPTQGDLLAELRNRCTFNGMPSVPLLVEFSKNPDVTGPISQHLIGFLRMLTKLRPVHSNTVVMVMVPPLPTGQSVGDNAQYTMTLKQFEKDCKMAKMLGQAVGILVHKFDLFEMETKQARYWYRRKSCWSREPMFGSTGMPTREWFDRQTDNFEQLLEVLRRAELA